MLRCYDIFDRKLVFCRIMKNLSLFSCLIPSIITLAFAKPIYNLTGDTFRSVSLSGRKKAKFSGRIKARIETEQCHLQIGDQFMYQLSSNYTVCKYDQDYYDRSRQWIDNARCRVCACFAPDCIVCCKIRLVPTSIPDTCVVDPVRRRTPLPSLGTCVAPILEAGSLGKRRIPRVCSNSKFRASLLGKEWTLDRFDPINYVISTRRSKGNSKRATTSKMSKISHQRLREIYLERLSRFPFIGPDGTDITVTI